MPFLLPIWNTSPLDQFTIRNLFSLKADFLGNLQITLTNICLYLIIATTIVFIYTLARNYESTKPKAHLFTKKTLISALDDMVIIMTELSAAFISNIVSYSAYLYSVGILLVSSYAFIPLFMPVLIYIMEQIIQNTIELHAQALAEVLQNMGNDGVLYRIYAYLTPYLRSYHLIFHIIRSTFRNSISVNSPYYDQMDNLIEQYIDVGLELLRLYRDIETQLDIPMHESPISMQEWE